MIGTTSLIHANGNFLVRMLALKWRIQKLLDMKSRTTLAYRILLSFEILAMIFFHWAFMNICPLAKDECKCLEKKMICHNGWPASWKKMALMQDIYCIMKYIKNESKHLARIR